SNRRYCRCICLVRSWRVVAMQTIVQKDDVMRHLVHEKLHHIPDRRVFGSVHPDESNGPSSRASAVARNIHTEETGDREVQQTAPVRLQFVECRAAALDLLES